MAVQIIRVAGPAMACHVARRPDDHLPGAAQQARRKAEGSGLKAYTQVVSTADGKRTRVRVGPFASRAEAEKAVAALKKAGLPGSILTL